MLDLAGTLQTVVTGLHTAGVETASTDPADILAPGVLVQLVDFQPVTLTGWDINLTLVLVAQDSDGGPGPAAALSSLLQLVRAYAQPDGPVSARSVQLPSNPAPLPGLLFPLTVRTEET
jgi:hypothetical protein